MPRVIRRALVAGATGTIGGAIARALLDQGAVVLGARRGSDRCVEQEGVIWYPFDAEDASTLLDFGVEPLDAVIYCIGDHSQKRTIVDTDDAEWARLYAVNAVGFARFYRACHVQARVGKARVVVLSSDTTRALNARNGSYSASKVALEAIAVTLAREEAPFGVRVNILAPALVDSPLAETLRAVQGIEREEYVAARPWGRLLTVEEVASAALDLVSGAAWEYATGQIFRMNGST